MTKGVHAAANYLAQICVIEKAIMIEEDGQGEGVGRSKGIGMARTQASQ